MIFSSTSVGPSFCTLEQREIPCVSLEFEECSAVDAHVEYDTAC